MVRLKDIAKEVGMDVSTISRALSDDPEINEDTRDRIKKVAEDMGYEKKIRQVRSGKIPGLIGVIVPEMLSGYYSDMLDGLQSALVNKGKSPLIGITDFDSNKAHAYINGFVKAAAEGIIYIMDAFEAPLKAKTEKLLLSCGIPTVFINGSNQHNNAFDSLYVDEKSGVRDAVNHLIGLGHKNIGYIGESRTPGRYETCRHIIEQNGLEYNPELFCVGKERLEKGGYLRMQELLSKDDKCSAVFIAYDQMTFGAIKALREKKIAVPNELSIVSFDNIDASPYVFGGLTTVATPLKETTELTVRLLLDRISYNNKAVQHVTIQPKLIVRNTTTSF